jgi:glycosyltransferase involved in cell wall biosynthesis
VISNLKSKIGIRSDSFVIGSVGRLDYVKGYDRLISAFAGLLNPVSGSHDLRFSNSIILLLVGDGAERGNLERQAKELNVDKQMVFAGYQKDIETYLQVMDVFILPSRSEGIAISLLEACASGIPVIVTDVGGNTEVIENGKTGIVIPSGDINALGAAISRLYTDESLQRRMGEAACKLVGDRFSLDKTLAEYENIYSGI